MNPAPKQPDQSTYSGRFAARLRQLREKAGLSVPDVVASINGQGQKVAASTYYKWETGAADPPLNSLPSIARSLGKSNVHQIMPKD